MLSLQAQKVVVGEANLYSWFFLSYSNKISIQFSFFFAGKNVNVGSALLQLVVTGQFPKGLSKT